LHATSLQNFPAPNALLPASAMYSFPILKGVRFDPADPLNIEFVFDAADQKTISKTEAKKLIEYFLAGLTTPEEDLWVNLSLYEKDRIAPESLIATDFGADLLGQDYVLKQLSSSLTYPESETGKAYWNALRQAQGPKTADAFNKIWIMPGVAKMYENGTSCFVVNATLKAMTAVDYLAKEKYADRAIHESPLVWSAASTVNNSACIFLTRTTILKCRGADSSTMNQPGIRRSTLRSLL
jgi:hypothetical protein